MLFRFADFTLDPEARRLCRGDVAVPIQPRVFELLLYLLQNRDRVVAHEELLREVWRGVTTTEGSLSRAVSLARSALAEPDGGRAGVLETVRGKGYRVAVPVDLVDTRGDAGGLVTLVGREKELRLLHDALDRALAARGAAVFVSGDAGIGKTRLAEEFARAAETRGAGTLWASAYEGEGGPAFWLWTQILTAHARSRTSDQLAETSEDVLAQVATLIPEFGGSLPEGRGGSKVAKDPGRFRPFEAVARLLDSACRERPLVLVLDDLHWADEASLNLLRFVASGARGQRLLLVGTFRAREAPDVLRDASTYCGRVLSFTQELRLEGLSREDAERFVAAAVREPPSADVVTRVHERTEGNPFFLQEVVRHADSLESWSAPVPESVRQAVRNRLEGVDAECSQILRLASVIGRDFSLPLLARASDRPAPEVLALLDQAERRGVASPLQATPATYRFRHMLIRETLYESFARAELAAPPRRRSTTRSGRASRSSTGSPTSRRASTTRSPSRCSTCTRPSTPCGAASCSWVSPRRATGAACWERPRRSAGRRSSSPGRSTPSSSSRAPASSSPIAGSATTAACPSDASACSKRHSPPWAKSPARCGPASSPGWPRISTGGISSGRTG